MTLGALVTAPIAVVEQIGTAHARGLSILSRLLDPILARGGGDGLEQFAELFFVRKMLKAEFLPDVAATLLSHNGNGAALVFARERGTAFGTGASGHNKSLKLLDLQELLSATSS